MSFGTIIYTWLFGKYVGNDDFGNKYYCNSKNHSDLFAKRWVIFEGEIEASKIPSHWHAWLHKTIDKPPLNYTPIYKWQKQHKPNMTGTNDAYLPKNHPLSMSKNIINNKDYEKWNP